MFQSSGRQGELPPPAPTAAEWAALPADAPFTYRVTEIKIGNPRTDRLLDVEPVAINNRGQIVGKMERVPALIPFWWRRLFGLPVISQIAPRPPFGETAFVWDAATGRVKTLPIPASAFTAQAFAINDRGQVIGTAQYVNPARRIKKPSGGVYEHVVLLTPVLPSQIAKN